MSRTQKGHARPQPTVQPQGLGRLTLAGIVHRDPAGADRLWDFLERCRPGGVSVELSRYSLAFRRSNRERLARTLDENLEVIMREDTDGRETFLSESGHVYAIRAAIGVPYEYEVCSTYCRRHGAPLELADLSSSSRTHLPALEELISLPNLRRLLAEPDEDPREEATRQRRVAEGLLLRTPLESARWPHPQDPEDWLREEHMARTIRRAISQNGDCQWVHVVGWQHLLWIDDRQTLYTRLLEYDPKRVIV